MIQDHDTPQSNPLDVPPGVPRTPGRFTRWLGRSLMRAFGWKLVGNLPDQRHVVMIIAPHSSNWDFLWGLLAKWALGLRVQFLAKRSLFWGPVGWFLRRIGGIAVDRESPRGMVDDIAASFGRNEKLWLVIAPEGTRSKVERWKTGFWRIARQARVPIYCVYFHYPERTVGLGQMFPTSDDMDADVSALRAWYAPWQGKNHG